MWNFAWTKMLDEAVLIYTRLGNNINKRPLFFYADNRVVVDRIRVVYVIPFSGFLYDVDLPRKNVFIRQYGHIFSLVFYPNL